MEKWYNDNMHKKNRREGFTLVELSLSLVFIATLSVAVALIISNSIATYRRGLTLNSVNTVGMEIVDDVRAAIQNSPSRSVAERCSTIYDQTDFQYEDCIDDGGLKFALLTKEGKVKMRGDKDDEFSTVPLFGAFCTGDYTYIWNSGYFFNGSAIVESGVEPASFSYKYATEKEEAEPITLENFRLLKVKDNERSVCVSMVVDQVGEYNYGANSEYENMGVKEDITGKFDISGDKYAVVSEEPVDVLATTGNLALYDFNIAQPVNGENSILYSVTFILGTIQGGVNIVAVGDNCVAPGDYKYTDIENFNYCAINKFNFAALATGG